MKAAKWNFSGLFAIQKAAELAAAGGKIQQQNHHSADGFLLVRAFKGHVRELQRKPSPAVSMGTSDTRSLSMEKFTVTV